MLMKLTAGVFCDPQTYFLGFFGSFEIFLMLIFLTSLRTFFVLSHTIAGVINTVLSAYSLVNILAMLMTKT